MRFRAVRDITAPSISACAFDVLRTGWPCAFSAARVCVFQFSRRRRLNWVNLHTKTGFDGNSALPHASERHRRRRCACRSDMHASERRGRGASETETRFPPHESIFHFCCRYCSRAQFARRNGVRLLPNVMYSNTGIAAAAKPCASQRMRQIFPFFGGHASRCACVSRQSGAGPRAAGGGRRCRGREKLLWPLRFVSFRRSERENRIGAIGGAQECGVRALELHFYYFQFHFRLRRRRRRSIHPPRLPFDRARLQLSVCLCVDGAKCSALCTARWLLLCARFPCRRRGVRAHNVEKVKAHDNIVWSRIAFAFVCVQKIDFPSSSPSPCLSISQCQCRTFEVSAQLKCLELHTYDPFYGLARLLGLRSSRPMYTPFRVHAVRARSALEGDRKLVDGLVISTSAKVANKLCARWWFFPPVPAIPALALGRVFECVRRWKMART